MRIRARSLTVLAGALAVHLLIVLAVLPFAHDCDHPLGGGPRSGAPAFGAGESASDAPPADCLACLFFVQARTGRPPVAPAPAPAERDPERVEPDRDVAPLSLHESPVLPRGPPIA